MDGGFLIHKVVWPREGTYNDAVSAYISYIKVHYGKNCIIVFDGYEEAGLQIKNAERQRRYRQKNCPNITFDGNTPLTCKQALFLSNEKNKSRFMFIGPKIGRKLY